MSGSTTSGAPHAPFSGHYPRAAPVDAYGNGGFRFADMSHKGSILIIPSGIWAWQPRAVEDITLSSLARVLAELAMPAFLLLGTGSRQVFPSIEVRRAFLDAHVGLEPMDTGAAARTFNVLFAEGRPVAAALLAVD